MDIKSRLNLCSPYIVTNEVLFVDPTTDNSLACGWLSINGSVCSITTLSLPHSSSFIALGACGININGIEIKQNGEISLVCGLSAKSCSSMRVHSNEGISFEVDKNSKCSNSYISLVAIDGYSGSKSRSCLNVNPDSIKMDTGSTSLKSSYSTTASASCIHLIACGEGPTLGGISLYSKDYICVDAGSDLSLLSDKGAELCAQDVYVKATDGDFIVEANGTSDGTEGDSGSGCSDGSGRIILSAENGVFVESDKNVCINSKVNFNSKACNIGFLSEGIINLSASCVEINSNELNLISNSKSIFIGGGESIELCSDEIKVNRLNFSRDSRDRELISTACGLVFCSQECVNIFTQDGAINICSWLVDEEEGADIYIESDGGIGISAYTQEVYIGAEEYGTAIIMKPLDTNESVGNIEIVAPILTVRASSQFSFNPIVNNETTNYTNNTLVTKKYVDDAIAGVSGGSGSTVDIPERMSFSVSGSPVNGVVTFNKSFYKSGSGKNKKYPSEAPMVYLTRDSDGAYINADYRYYTSDAVGSGGILEIKINSTSAVSGITAHVFNLVYDAQTIPEPM